MAFSRRIIDLEFQLGEGDFGEAGVNTVKLTGLRCTADISKAGGASMSQLDLRVFGMPLDVMNKLTVLNKLAFQQQRFNSVIVSAGDTDSGVAAVFGGTIQEAWADGREAPDVFFHVSAFSGMFEFSKPIPPTSYNGSVDVATALGGIATQMGYSLENSGVTGKIQSGYWPGTLGAQLKAVCRHANVDYLLDPVNRVLAVWPKGTSRDGAAIEISAQTGMVGYPAFTQNGLQFTTIYNPSLVFGRTVNITSDFTAANHAWTVAAISHNLDTLTPGGRWFTEVECTLLGQAVGIYG